MKTRHSILPPSKAARRYACPGSRALEAKYPQEQSPAAREGETAHWVASEMLRWYLTFSNEPWKKPSVSPDGEVITQDMLDGAQLYCEAILGVTEVSNFHIEEKLDISSIYPGCWGTPDCWTIDGSDLHIWDYKFGHGFVEVVENWQLIEYAAGACQTLKCVSIYDVYFHIVQPRSYHPKGHHRIWKIDVLKLKTYFEKLRKSESVSMSDEAYLSPSAECTYCPARHACTALQKSSMEYVDITQQAIAHDLKPQELGFELKYLMEAAMLIDARITGLTEEALAMIRKGKLVPFFKAEQSTGREIWKQPPEEVIQLGRLFDIKLSKPQEVITPKQAIKAGIPEDIVHAYSDTPRGAVKLVLTKGNVFR
jgi:Protein of unknown function (DUF2800)